MRQWLRLSRRIPVRGRFDNKEIIVDFRAHGVQATSLTKTIF
jgi:hypothetical protein